jgi:hypothetical protein
MLTYFFKIVAIAENPSSIASASHAAHGLAASQTTTHVGFLFPSMPM